MRQGVLWLTLGQLLGCSKEERGCKPSPDLVGDNVDQDCDGGDGTDKDGDGYASLSSGGTDCDDTDPNRSPTATDIAGDAIDQNCDGVDGTDIDQDGVASLASGGKDCDDGDAAVFAGARERFGDGLDNDCSGSADELFLVDAPGRVVGTRSPDRVGNAVAGADFNGDGRVELVAGAPQHHGYSSSANAVGHAGLWSVPLQGERTLEEADTTLSGLAEGGSLGEWVGVLPDLDGDGRPELAVSDPSFDAEGRVDSGAVFVWFQLPSGEQDAGSADLVIAGAPGAKVERLVAGDLTGDGVLDLVVPVQRSVDPQGGVHVLEGPFTFTDGPIDASLTAAASFSSFGNGMAEAAVGDLDGDGVDDLVIGGPQASSEGSSANGRILVRKGPLQALPPNTPPDAVFLGSGDNAALGKQLGVADMDGDGLDEIVSSSDAHYPSSYRGQIWIFRGTVQGVAIEADLLARIEGDEVGDQLGASLVLPGDLDGDGLQEILAGSQVRAEVILLGGPFQGVSRVSDLPHGVVFGVEGSDLGAVNTIAVVDDTDGDGVRDLWLGTPNASLEAQSSGAAWLLPGPW